MNESPIPKVPMVKKHILHLQVKLSFIDLVIEVFSRLYLFIMILDKKRIVNTN